MRDDLPDEIARDGLLRIDGILEVSSSSIVFYPYNTACPPVSLAPRGSLGHLGLSTLFTGLPDDGEKEAEEEAPCLLP